MYQFWCFLHNLRSTFDILPHYYMQLNTNNISFYNAKEIEDLKSSKNSNTDFNNNEKKFKDLEEKLCVEVQCKNDLIKELENQTSLTKGMELAFETQKDPCLQIYI